MTDISVSTTNYQVERRDWLLGRHGTTDTPGVVLDVSTFTPATHYPNGYLLSGIVLGVITASSNGLSLVVGPYDDAAADGRQVAAGILYSSVKVPDPANTAKDTGGAMLVHGFVRRARLPIANAATGKGFLDAAAEVDLKLIHFAG